MPSKYGERLDRFYHSARWRRLRALVLARNHGMCERCNRKPATEVHHIIPVTDENVDDYSISLDEKNLMALCKECHDSIRSEGEKGTVILFDENGDAVAKDKKTN